MLGSDDRGLGYGPSKKKNLNRKKVMSPAIEAQSLLRISFPTARYGKLENVFYQAVRFIAPRVERDFTLRRARSIWEGTAKRIDSDEMDALRAARIEESKIEQQQLRARLAALDETIASYEAAAHRQEMARQGKEVG